MAVVVDPLTVVNGDPLCVLSTVLTGGGPGDFLPPELPDRDRDDHPDHHHRGRGRCVQQGLSSSSSRRAPRRRAAVSGVGGGAAAAGASCVSRRRERRDGRRSSCVAVELGALAPHPQGHWRTPSRCRPRARANSPDDAYRSSGRLAIPRRITASSSADTAGDAGARRRRRVVEMRPHLRDVAGPIERDAPGHRTDTGRRRARRCRPDRRPTPPCTCSGAT